MEDKDIEKLRRKIKSGKWISFDEVKPTTAFDWILVQFVENCGFVGLPVVACLVVDSDGQDKWVIHNADRGTNYYYNTDCHPTSWKIIDKSPEWKEKNKKFKMKEYNIWEMI